MNVAIGTESFASVRLCFSIGNRLEGLRTSRLININPMPQINFYVIFITALFPILLGAIYYNPKVLGTAWMNAAGITEEHVRGGNMIKTILLSYLFGLFLSYILFLFGVHQSSLYQLFLHEPELQEQGSEINTLITNFMNDYGDKHRTFGHGVIHGVELMTMMSFALIGISCLHERRSLKYMWIHLLFWVICGGLMSGVLCAFV